MFTLILEKIKVYKNTLLLLLIGVVISVLVIQNNTISNLNTLLKTSTVNNKAMFTENLDLKGKAELYQLTIDLLHYFNDSINQKLDSVVKDNKIKTKNLKLLQYIKTKTSKTDTLVYRDTLFVKKLKVDTLLINPGYTLRLLLEYPNKIITTPTFINEQYIIFASKKETIEPPKKLFLLRWFQKKHTVVTVDVINTNKYSDTESKRFIEIIK